MTDSDPSAPADLLPYLAEAARLADEGDPGGAFALLLELEPRSPEDPTLLCMLGLMAGESDAPGMAYDFYRRALAAQPDDPGVLALLGTGLARYDDPDAEGVLRLAAITAPELALARLRYGAYLAREGMLDLALTELAAAQEMEPENPEIKREIGVAHLLGGADQQGIEALEDAAALAPDDPDLHVLHALALLRTGTLSEASEELHGASEGLADDAELQLLAALACASQGWEDEAWNALARAEVGRGVADDSLVREVEEAIEAGADASREFLVTQLAPGVLRARLVARD